MNKTKTLYGLLSVGAALVLSACASVPGSFTYPASWAPLDSDFAADGCPRLEGTYSNYGTGTFPRELGESPSLGNIFARLGPETGTKSVNANGRIIRVLSHAVSVSIVQTSETLKVTFFGKNEEQISLDFRRYRFNWSEERYDDLFLCYHGSSYANRWVRKLAKEPRLRFFGGPRNLATGFAPMYFEGGLNLVLLLKAEDESLVVQWRNDWSKNSIWWRYPLIKDVQ